ncbi:MAG: T9SS type A sorting domain-containing protein [Bacteroidetes bacterium]|nr:T9SS type A sorting domain-containing protein [Bacteroidota bacterium]
MSWPVFFKHVFTLNIYPYDTKRFLQLNLTNSLGISDDNSITLNAGTGFSSYTWSDGSTLSSLTIDGSGTGTGTTEVFVIIENSSGCFNSDTIQITFSVCTGFDDETKNPDLHIYPNPFSTTFHLCLDDQADIYIYDTAGKLAEEKLNRNGDITLGENLATGLYTIIIIQEKSKSVFRVIKNSALKR